MIPVEPSLHDGAELIMISEAHDHYAVLPASVDAEGIVMTEYELTAEELDRVICGGRVRLWVHTLGNPLPPTNLEIAEPVRRTRES